MLEAADFHPGRSGRDHLFSLALALGRSPTAATGSWGASGPQRQRVDAVLELVELPAPARRRVGGYSLGMRQRLGLAGALLGDPELLILDEPANGLDPEGVRWLRDFMRSFAAEGKTVLVSSHVLAEVAQTRRPGHHHQQGQARHLRAARPADRAAQRRRPRARTGRAPAAGGAGGARGSASTLLDGDELLVEGAPSARVGELAFAAGIPLHELVPESSSLEDVFLELTAKEPS